MKYVLRLNGEYLVDTGTLKSTKDITKAFVFGDNVHDSVLSFVRRSAPNVEVVEINWSYTDGYMAHYIDPGETMPFPMIRRK